MITKIVLKDSHKNLYTLPHNILKLSCYAVGKSTSLEFSVVSRDLYLTQGNEVFLYIDDILHFSGTIFAFSKDYNTISAIAYDNLIYLKSKDTLLIKNSTASEVISDICSKIGVTAGKIADTSYVLPYNLFENTSYFDIVNKILSDSKQISGNTYFLTAKNGSIDLINRASDFNIVQIDENALISTYQETSSQDIYNAIHVYQVSESGIITSFYAYDNNSISILGKFQKSINVDRNLSVAQCNLIAQNYLTECEKSTFSMQIDVISFKIINIYDIILLNSQKFYVLESILNISASSEIYTLTLEKVV